jgi:hypothetical protein
MLLDHGAAAEDEAGMMQMLTWRTGQVAALAWGIDAVLVAGSAFMDPSAGMVVRNVIGAALFLLAALLLAWRAWSVAAACRAGLLPAVERSLLRSELAGAAVMALLGVLMLTAIISRVFGEGLPVLG